MRLVAGGLVAGGLVAGADGLNFTAGAGLAVSGAALTGVELVERLVGVAATTIGGMVWASREVFVEGAASTIRIGSSIDPVRLARGVAVISLRIGPLLAAAVPAELDDTAAGGWKLPTLAGDAGGGTVAGPIIAYGFCHAGFWQPAAAVAAANRMSVRFIDPTSVPNSANICSRNERPARTQAEGIGGSRIGQEELPC